MAGSHRQHELYIWDKATGSLVKMLTGQKGETLLDIAVGCSWFTITCNSAYSAAAIAAITESLHPRSKILKCRAFLIWHIK